MELRLTVVKDEESHGAAPYLAILGEELREFDNVEISEIPDIAPNGTKGAGGYVGLVASLPVAGVTSLFRFLRAWVIRTGRTVEVSIGSDTIKIIGASEEQQDRVIEAWLGRHAAGS
jgi:hypothetical protein